MRKFFLFIITLVATLIFFSCKKDSNPAGRYFVNMTIDNKKFSFKDSLFASKHTAPPQLTIFAYSKTNGQLQCLFSDSSQGLYLDTYDANYKQRIYQFTINSIIGYNNNVPILQTLVRPDPATANPIKLNITQVNDSFVEGTFDGNLTNGSGSTATISNGEFRVPFK